MTWVATYRSSGSTTITHEFPRLPTLSELVEEIFSPPVPPVRLQTILCDGRETATFLEELRATQSVSAILWNPTVEGASRVLGEVELVRQDKRTSRPPWWDKASFQSFYATGERVWAVGVVGDQALFSVGLLLGRDRTPLEAYNRLQSGSLRVSWDTYTVPSEDFLKGQYRTLLPTGIFPQETSWLNAIRPFIEESFREVMS